MAFRDWSTRTFYLSNIKIIRLNNCLLSFVVIRGIGCQDQMALYLFA